MLMLVLRLTSVAPLIVGVATAAIVVLLLPMLLLSY